MEFSLVQVVNELKVHLAGEAAPLGFFTVGLQFPEGLIDQAVSVCDELESLLGSVNGIAIEYMVFADVLYGACNVDDIGSRLVGVNVLVHFGHSAIVPNTLVKVIYVPVLDTRGNAQKIAEGLAALCKEHNYKTVALVTTAQFTSCLTYVQPVLDDMKCDIVVHGEPQEPLPKFEILGCTCRKFPPGTDAVISVVDGDFHYEAACLSNVHLPAYRLSPVTGEYESLSYRGKDKIASRRIVINECAKVLRELMQINDSNKSVGKAKAGLIFGTLGRQGSQAVFSDLLARLERLNIPTKVLSLSEVLPHYLFPHKDVIFFAQLACPRLTLDWDEELKACGLVVINFAEFDKVLSLYAQGADLTQQKQSSQGTDIEDYLLVNFTRTGHRELCYYGRPDV